MSAFRYPLSLFPSGWGWFISLLGVGSLVAVVAAQIAFTTIASGQQSRIEEARQVVVRSSAEWTALWKEHAPDQSMPSVDFKKYTVVGVFLGSRPTGGYSVGIASIERAGAGVVVTYREERPSPRDVVIQAITMPFQIARIERYTGPIAFRAESKGQQQN